MAERMANLGIMQIAQDFLFEHWNWTDVEKAKLGDVAEMGEIIKARLENAGCEIEEMYGIEHDKDEHKMWNQCKKTYELPFDSHHAHFVIKLRKGRRKTIPELALAVGIEKKFIEKPLSGEHAYGNMLSCLIDIESPTKYRYKPSSVCTIAGKTYMEHYSDFLKADIIKGEITIDNIFADDDLKLAYTLHKNMFDDAFATKKTIDEMRQI